MDDTILRVDDIQKFYGNKGNLTKAVDHISFSVRKGEFLGIMGSSGSGKTTLLNCISTIDTVTSGHIYVEGKDITALHGSQLADFRGKNWAFIFRTSIRWIPLKPTGIFPLPCLTQETKPAGFQGVSRRLQRRRTIPRD